LLLLYKTLAETIAQLLPTTQGNRPTNLCTSGAGRKIELTSNEKSPIEGTVIIIMIDCKVNYKGFAVLRMQSAKLLYFMYSNSRGNGYVILSTGLIRGYDVLDPLRLLVIVGDPVRQQSAASAKYSIIYTPQRCTHKTPLLLIKIAILN
jgi:hypothetical protein